MRRCLLALALLSAGLPAHAEDLSGPTIVQVVLNGEATHQVIALYSGKGTFSASPSDWKKIGVVLSPTEAAQQTLSANLLGATVKVDEDTQVAQVQVPANRLPEQQVTASIRSLPKLAPSASGVLLNYNLAANWADTYEAISLGHEVRFNMGGGEFSSQGQVNYETGQKVQYKRQYTSWKRDNYKNLTSVEVGDVFAIGPASTTTNLMGIRFTKDPSELDPYTPSYPLPTINGLAVDAGTLQVLANQQFVRGGVVEKGPFSVQDLHLQSGLNNLTSTITDRFGRQTTIDQGSYYFAPTLLRTGLDTFDVTAGVIRRDYSDTYKGFGASGRYARGLTDTFTANAEIQAGADGRNIAVGAIQKLGNAGVLSWTGGLSSSNKNGWLAGFGYDYRGANWGVEFKRQTQHKFWQLRDPTLASYQPTSSTQFGFNWNNKSRNISASLSYSNVQTTTSRFKQIGSNFTFRHRNLNFSLIASYDLQRRSPSISASVSWNFGASSVSAEQQVNQGIREATLRAEHSNHFSDDVSTSVNAQVSRGEWGRYATLGGILTTNLGSGRLTYQSAYGQTNISSLWSGALVIRNGLTPVRSTTDSWLVVDVPGVVGVPVKVDGHEIGKTDKNGQVVVGGLPSLVPLRVSLDDKSIPMGIDVPTSETTVAISRRGGAMATFEVSTLDARVFEVQHLGRDLAVGSITTGGSEVGFNGQLVLEHPKEGRFISLKMNGGGTCVGQLPKTISAYQHIIKINCK